MGTVIDLTTALWRRIAALELDVVEHGRAVPHKRRHSWQYEVHADKPIAERRLSIAEEMPRLSEPDDALKSTGPAPTKFARHACRRR